jgi:DNA ligase-associated metallophosphoesterase
MEIVVLNNHFELLASRAIFWCERSALILSDTHFGKTAHFRREGISIPDHSFYKDLEVLDDLIIKYAPLSLIVVGDMFHSYYNKEVAVFARWRDRYPRLDIHLAKGNHDILHAEIYNDLKIMVHRSYVLDGFIFSHELCRDLEGFCFNGHIHPGVQIRGLARQELKLPCFHFSMMSCTLPAFSRFTGLSLITVRQEDQIFVIAGSEVMRY